MLWVHGHYTYYTLNSAGIDRRQILVCNVGPRTERVTAFSTTIVVLICFISRSITDIEKEMCV